LDAPGFYLAELAATGDGSDAELPAGGEGAYCGKDSDATGVQKFVHFLLLRLLLISED
jgi:hypothetical protein